MSGNKRLHHVISESRVFTTRNIEFIIRPAPNPVPERGLNRCTPKEYIITDKNLQENEICFIFTYGTNE